MSAVSSVNAMNLFIWFDLICFDLRFFAKNNNRINIYSEYKGKFFRFF
jgi:hypothetical protein